MKKLIAALLLLPSLCSAAGGDLVLMQRLPDDSNSINRLVTRPAGTNDGVLGYLGSTQRPYFLQLGQGLQLSGGVLSSTVQAGPIGPQGATGPQGPKGDTGSTGAAGVAGPKGDIGLTGAVGAIGPAGPAGVKGDTGTTGAQGPVGPAGSIGPQGLTGLAGPLGSQGLKGDIGLTGPTGAKGDTGDTGAQGVPGAVGPQGPIGVTGPTGPVGPAGASAPLPSGSVAARTLNTAFQPSTTRPVLASYAVDISVTSLLLTGTQGAVSLQYADNSAMTTNLVTIDGGTNSTGGVLNVTNSATVKLVGLIPAGKFARIATVNTTGTPTFSYRAGNETVY